MPKCFDCGQELHRVPKPGYLNSDQWDDIKLGDYFAACSRSTRENGNCYFRDRTRSLTTLKRLPEQEDAMR